MKHLFGWSVLATVFFFGCNSSDEGKGFNVNWNVEVVKIDRNTKTIETRSNDWSCDDSVAVQDTEVVVSGYEIKNGNLYLWDPEDCSSAIWKGTATDIVGTWTQENQKEIDIRTVLPQAKCGAGFQGSEDSTSREIGKFTSVVSEKQIKISGTLNICLDEGIKSTYTDSSSGFRVLESGCSFAVLENIKTKKTGRLESTTTSNGITQKFTFGEKICEVTTPMTFGPQTTKPDCSKENDANKKTQEFYYCILGTGFYSTPLAKADLPGFPKAF